MKVAIGNDHTSVELKLAVLEYLKEAGIEYTDFGPNTTERTDYPIYGEKVARAVASGEYDRGILICGTGIGMSITANKIAGIRAVVCSEPYSAVLSRNHNDSNVLCFGARVVGSGLGVMIVSQWLAAEYEGGRHQRRVDMINALDQGNREKEPPVGTCG
jgi:ribose 5-phosphate isomerase B